MFALFFFVCLVFFSLSSPLGRRKKEACAAVRPPSVKKACCIVHLPSHAAILVRLQSSIRFTAPPSAMAEMSDLTSALTKMELTKKGQEDTTSPPEQKESEENKPSPPAASAAISLLLP